MEYFFESDDEDSLAVSHKFNEKYYGLDLNNPYDDDDDNDENVTQVSTNPFLNPPTSMGRGIPANYLDADDETQRKLINDAKSKFFFNKII